METFADYILSEKDYIKKMEIAYYLHKREGIFFDTSVVLKTEIARMFVEKMKIDVDENLVITACSVSSTTKKLVATNVTRAKAKRIKIYNKLYWKL